MSNPPCAECKLLRRRCGEMCLLAPYFPSDDLHRFVTAHRVFGASNIIKILQQLPFQQREDAVTSIVYEAMARIRDPVYGCAGVVCGMHSHISNLQSELATAQAELLSMKMRLNNLLSLLSEKTEVSPCTSPESEAREHEQEQERNRIFDVALSCSFVEEDPLDMWESYLCMD